MPASGARQWPTAASPQRCCNERAAATESAGRRRWSLPHSTMDEPCRSPRPRRRISRPSPPFGLHARTDRARPSDRPCAPRKDCMSRKPVPAQAGDRSRLEVTFDKPQLLSALFGHYDQNLVALENRLDVYITARGNRVGLEGTAEQVALARDVLNDLYK